MKYTRAFALFFVVFAALGQSTPKVLVPHESWTCGMPEGIPAPESGTLIFEMETKFEKVLDLGKTPYGDRKVVVGQEGTVSGSKLSGSVMPGALDLELKLSNGTMEIEQFFVLKTSDGKYVYMRNAGTGADSADIRVVMDFEAPNAAPSGVAQFGEVCCPARREYSGENADDADLRCIECFPADQSRKHHADQQTGRHSESIVGLSKAGSFGETR
jgi:hypothetical protein